MSLEDRELLRANRNAVEPPSERPPKSYFWWWVALAALIGLVWFIVTDR